MKQHRDSIDFAKENIPRLFLRLFVPTFLGLLFGAMLNIADGIFVGQGVGSDALAAVVDLRPVSRHIGAAISSRIIATV